MGKPNPSLSLLMGILYSISRTFIDLLLVLNESTLFSLMKKDSSSAISEAPTSVRQFDIFDNCNSVMVSDSSIISGWSSSQATFRQRFSNCLAKPYLEYLKQYARKDNRNQ